MKWKTVKLGEVCKFVRGPFGGSLKKNSFVKEGLAVYEQQHAINSQCKNFRYFIDRKKFNEMSRFEVKPGDLLMSCSGTIGKTTIVPKGAPKGIINQALLKITTKNQLDNNFLNYFMKSSIFSKQLMETVEGAAIKNVASVKILKEIEIPLPTITQQKLIIASLNSIFNEIEKMIKIELTKRETIKTFVEKISDNIFDDLMNNSKILKLSSVINFENGDRGKNYPSKKFQLNSGIPFINAGDLSIDGEISQKGMVYIAEERFNLLGAGKIEIDDILFCLRGSLGKCAINKSFKKGAIASSLVIMRPEKKKILPGYLLSYLKSGLVKKFIKDTAGGAAQPNLSAKTVSNYEIPLPSIETQTLVVNKIKKIEEEYFKLRRIMSQKGDKIEKLKLSILSNKFSYKAA